MVFVAGANRGIGAMPTKIFKVAEARASFSSLLARAKER